MSLPNHTAGPWRADAWSSHAATTIIAAVEPHDPREVSGQRVANFGRIRVAECVGSQRVGGNVANAARIVACVNYCAGVSNADLESGTVTGGLAAFIAADTRLETRVDALWSALRSIIDLEHHNQGEASAKKIAQDALSRFRA